MLCLMWNIIYLKTKLWRIITISAVLLSFTECFSLIQTIVLVSSSATSLFGSASALSLLLAYLEGKSFSCRYFNRKVSELHTTIIGYLHVVYS